MFVGGSVRKLQLVVVAFAAAFLIAGCSGGSDVRSNSGPSTTRAESAKSDDLTTTTASSGPKNSPALYLQGAVSVPAGEAGKLSVVFTAVPDGVIGGIPVIVRNSTPKAVEDVSVTGTARGVDGSLVGSGSSQGFEPAVLEPGEWGFGYMAFDQTLPAGTTIETTATGNDVSDTHIFDTVQLTISELNLASSDSGAHYVGIVANPHDKKSVSHGSVYIGCFDASSNMIDTFSGFTSGEVVAGGTASFDIAVDHGQTCAAIAVGASGYAE